MFVSVPDASVERLVKTTKRPATTTTMESEESPTKRTRIPVHLRLGLPVKEELTHKNLSQSRVNRRLLQETEEEIKEPVIIEEAETEEDLGKWRVVFLYVINVLYI